MIEGGTDGAEAGGGDITGALVVAAPTLSKGVTTVHLASQVLSLFLQTLAVCG